MTRHRPHRRLRLRDREEDGRARARPRGARRGLASVVRADGPDRDRDRRLGHRGRCRRRRLPRRRRASELVVEGAERGGELLFVEGQGSLVHPPYSGVTLGLIHGSAPHLFVLCHVAGSTEIEGCPGHPIPPLAELVELHERIALPAPPGEGRRASRSTPPASTRPPPPSAIAALPPRPAFRPTTRSASAPRRLLDAILARLVAAAGRPLGRGRSTGVEARRRMRARGCWQRCSRSRSPARGRRAPRPTSARTTTPRSTRPTRARRSTRTWRASASAQIVLTVRWHAERPARRSRTSADLDRTIAAAARGRPPRRARHLPVPAARGRGGPRLAPSRSRAWVAARRDRVPGRQGSSSSERAEPAGLLAAAVRPGRRERLGAGVRPVPRGRVRRAEGRRPGDHRDRRRALPARERPSRRRGATSRPRPSASSPRSAPGTARAAGALPLMDGFSFHPYPNEATDPLEPRLSAGRTPGSSTSTGSSRRSGTRSTEPRSRRPSTG